MAAIAAVAVAAFSAVSGAVAAVGATVAAVGAAAATWATAAGVAGAFSAAMTALKVLSVASSIYSLVRKPKSTAGTPSPVAFKADPNAPITFVAGKAAVGGNIVMGQTHAPKNRFLTYVTALSHGGPVVSVTPFTAGDQVVTFSRDNGEGASGRYQDRMWQKIGLGAVGAAALLMTSTATKYTPARAGPLTEWTANHKLSGIAHSMLSMWSDTERYPNGVPKPLWVVHGGPVYDPRKDSTYPGGVGPQRWNDRATWSHVGNENPHLHALSFLIGHTYNGVRFGGAGIPIGGIDVAAYVEGANICDANGWKLSYPWSTAMRKWDVLATMLQAGGARPIARGAKISCVTQAPRVSIGTITEADLVGDFSVTGTQTRRDRINTVIPRVRMPSLKWSVQPYGRVTGATYVAEDGGERPREIEYEGVSGADGGKQSRQLAAYDLTNLREGIVATLPLSVKWLRCRAGDCLTVDAPETLLNGQKVVVIKREFDPGSLTVTLTVQSETDAKHAFALGQVDAPPPTPALTGVDPLVLEPPAPTAWETEPGVRPGGGSVTSPGVAPVIRVTPGAGDYDGTDDEPSAREVLIRYRIAGLRPDTGLPYSWSAPVAFTPSPDGYELTGLAPATTYELEIAYRARGITSNWTAYGTVTTGGLLATDSSALGGRPDSEILDGLDAVPGLIDAAVADLDLALSGAISDLDAAVAALFGQVNDPATGTIARIGSLETATADLELGKADASRVDALEATVNTAGTGLSARTASLETATADLELGKADASRVDALEASVNTAGTGLLARATSLETATADLALGKADASRVDALEATVNTAGTGLSARTASLETATADLALGKADASRVAIVEANVQGKGFLNRNAEFSQYTGTAAPNYWSDDGSGWAGISRAAGANGTYAMRQAAGLGENVYAGQLTEAGSLAPSQWIVIEGEFRLDAGTLERAGIYLTERYADGAATASDHALNFYAEKDATGVAPGNGVVGRTYRFSFLRKTGPDASRAYFYAMASWPGWGETATKSCTLTWFKCGFRPATRAELEVGVATSAGATSLNARYASLETATADLSLGKASAARVSLLEARSGGSNLLPKAQWFAPHTTLAPWGHGNSSVPALSAYVHPNPATGPGAGELPLVSVSASGPGGSYSEFGSPLFSVQAGKRYCASVYVCAVACTAYVFIYWRNAAGDVVGNTPLTVIPSSGNVGPLANWFRAAAFGVAPAGAVTGEMRLRREPTYPGYTYSEAWFLRPMVSEATPLQSEPPPFMPAAMEARVIGTEVATLDLYGRTEARWAKGVAVPGADAFVYAVAELTPGLPATSSVAIGAQQVAIYNPNGEDWNKALEVVGGNVILYGGLQAGAFIRLGTGAGWPVALKPLDFTASDGEVVSFGTDLGTLPALTFAMNNLAPLTAGESYDVKATSLTATGFTLSAKINIPATPASQSVSSPDVAVTIGGNSGLYITTSGVAESADGTYSISASGSQQLVVVGTDFPMADEEVYATIYLAIYVMKAGVWTLVASPTAEVMARPSDYGGGFKGAVTEYWNFTEVIQAGAGVTDIAVVRTGSNNGRTGAVTNVGPFSWQSQGAGSGVRSATPSGQKTRITVRPQ